MDDFTKYAIQQGPWAVMAIGAAYSIWHAAKWVGLDIIKPIAHRHLSFVDEASSVLAAIAESIRFMSEEMERLREQHTKQCETCPRKPRGPEEIDTDKVGSK